MRCLVPVVDGKDWWVILRVFLGYAEEFPFLKGEEVNGGCSDSFFW